MRTLGWLFSDDTSWSVTLGWLQFRLARFLIGSAARWIGDERPLGVLLARTHRSLLGVRRSTVQPVESVEDHVKLKLAG